MNDAIKEIRVFRGNTKNNNLTKGKNNIEKMKDNNDKNDDMNYSIGLTMKSTNIFSDDKHINNNKATRKSNISRRSTKKKSSHILKNNLIYIGDIEQAKIHSNANRPLKKVGEFDSETQFCKCCGLPCEKPGVLEKYSFKDSTEEFIKHGQVISLYFSFYIYSIFILSYAFFSISLPTLILTQQKANELDKICNKISNNLYIDECSIYLNNADKGSSYSSILDFSGLNIKNYKIIYSQLSSNEKEVLDNMMVNYSVLNFISLITILYFNFGYILLLNNQKNIPDIEINSPKKYSIIISEMDGFYSYLKEKFLSDNSTNNEEDKNNDKKSSKENKVEKNSDREKLSGKEDEATETGVEKFKNLFKEKIAEIFLEKKQPFNISQINICFKINEYIKKEGKLEKCNECIEKVESLPYQIQKNEGLKEGKKYYYSPLSNFNIHWFEKYKELSEIKKEKEKLEKEIDNLLKESKKVNMDKFAGAVIISFNTIKEKEDFLSNFPNNFWVHFLNIAGRLRYFFCFCCVKKIDNTKFWRKFKIQIEEAPEPEDIVFENLEFTTITKTYRVVGMNMISLLLIGIGFAIIFGLQNLQNYVNKKKYIKFVYYLISLCITIVSSIINIIFQSLLNFLTKTEKLKSITDYYLSYSVKLALFSFLVSGIIPLVCDVITDTENYEILISNMIVMFLVNSIVTPLMWTFSPLEYIKKLKIYLIEKNKEPNLYHNMNQKELNKLYELSDMNISYKYSYIAKTLLMTFLYISIFPFGVLISLGGFFLCYFLEKYNYINFYKRPEMLNNDLFFFYVKNFVFFLFFLGVGDYIFLSDIYNNKAWSLANIIILGILLVVPYQFLLKHDFIGFKESEINQLTFEDVYLDFYTDYERANPMTKKEGMKKYIEKLFEKGNIDKDQKKNYLKNIENINLMKAYYENRKNINFIKIQKMLAPIQIKISKNKSFKPTFNKNFKLSGNFKNSNNQFKRTAVLRGGKNSRLKLINNNDNESKDDAKKNEKINEVNEEIEKISITNKEKGKNENINEKDIEINVKEKELESLEATRRFREYYNDPILLRMADSMRLAELLQTDEVSEDSYDSLEDVMENIEEENSRIHFEMNEENEEDEEKEKENENEKSEEN